MTPKKKGTKNGTHRRASKKTHSDSVDGAGDVSLSLSFPSAIIPFLAIDVPKPKPIPYSGVRAGEIIGHRLWWVIKEKGMDWICSIAHRRLWKPGETIYGNLTQVVSGIFTPIYGGVYSFGSKGAMIAEIAATENMVRLRNKNDDDYVGWAFNPFMVWDGLDETRTFVSGKIKMWGDVVEHETGYRAEYAKLISIDKAYGECDLEKLRAKYLP